MRTERGIDRSFVSEDGVIANEAFAILPELMEQRRADPQDDLITGLVHAEIDEDGETRTLTLEEIVGFVQLISSAGTETVARASSASPRSRWRGALTSDSCCSTTRC